jgi:hypothetical protein
MTIGILTGKELKTNKAEIYCAIATRMMLYHLTEYNKASILI